MSSHSSHPLPSEFRQDPVTGKWIILARSRARRPTDLLNTLTPHAAIPSFMSTCPFCDLKKYPQAPDTLIRPRGKSWRVRAFPNKYPALVPLDHLRAWKEGPYTAMEGRGFHEVITTKAHNGYFFELSPEDAQAFLLAWRDRYRVLMEHQSVAYIQIIENHGRDAGASLEHSHAQLFALPVIPSDEVLDLLQGAENYFRQNGSCAYCDILSFESKRGSRIVYENDQFVVLTPYAPRTEYEQWVIPKLHAAGFEQLTDDDVKTLADALQTALRALASAFRDPPYNLYLTSAPCDTEGYVCDVDAFSHFHWNIRLLPRFQKWAGFELATGVEIVSTDPNDAAAVLRSHIPAEGHSHA